MDPTEPLPRRAVPRATSAAATVTFSLRAPGATAVELALFDGTGAGERRIGLGAGPHGVWSVAVPGIRHGQLYGFRVHGPFDPARGLCFNPAKLLVDPRARAIDGTFAWSDLVLGYQEGAPDAPDPTDSGPVVPRSVVVLDDFDWRGDAPPRTPWDRTVIYECHVGGMTRLHPEVPPALRGTYLGLTAEPVIDHLLALGVTAVQLLPIHHHAVDRRLARLGLTNYWGYNTIGYFAPDSRYATASRGEQVSEFRAMVRALHGAGIEVLLDVVYNHTAEGDAAGPTLAFRGIDNRGYYRLEEADPRRYVDYTGVGNTLDAAREPGLSLILESLRYWVREMHVDGFRFDLATTLGRRDDGFDPSAPLFEAIRADPDLSAVKLIAEPWDLGPEGYRLGQFPAGWAEWNDRFRDGARRYWGGFPDRPGELAARLGGSLDLFAGRSPHASVNFITCHDGFTLRDLVSYERKHNEANLEENRDGHHENLSRSWGVEGPTIDPEIRAARARAARGLVATLALAQGVPMIAHGDELGRSQLGNTTAYCHDSPLTWIDWQLDDDARELLAYFRVVFRIRARHPAFRLTRLEDVASQLGWLEPLGVPAIGEPDLPRAFGFRLAGPPALVALFNGEEEPRQFLLPGGGPWLALVPPGAALHEGEIEVGAHEVAVFEEGVRARPV